MLNPGGVSELLSIPLGRHSTMSWGDESLSGHFLKEIPMARGSPKRPGGKRSRRPGRSLLKGLKAKEARQVLDELIEEQPSLRSDAERIARSILTSLDYQAVAESVKHCILGVEVERIWGRSGRKRWGYVEPTEAAREVLEEDMKPFLEDIQRFMSLGLTEAAVETCKGIVVGLYSLNTAGEAEIFEHIPDFPGEMAAYALGMLRTSASGRSKTGSSARAARFPEDFLREQVPEWEGFLARQLSRRRR